MEFKREDLELFRQWFESIQDGNPGFLTPSDYDLARRVYQQLGVRVPNSVLKAIVDVKTMTHQQLTSELIRERLAIGGNSATWLAEAVISYYRPKATAPSLTGFTNLLDAEAQSAFFQLLAIRNEPDWSDDDLAVLCRDCEQHLNRLNSKR